MGFPGIGSHTQNILQSTKFFCKISQLWILLMEAVINTKWFFFCNVFHCSGCFNLSSLKKNKTKNFLWVFNLWSSCRLQCSRLKWLFWCIPSFFRWIAIKTMEKTNLHRIHFFCIALSLLVWFWKPKHFFPFSPLIPLLMMPFYWISQNNNKWKY